MPNPLEEFGKISSDIFNKIKDTALDIYNQGEQTFKKDELLRDAEQKYKMGKIDSAIKLYEDILKQDPLCSPALINLARIYCEQNDKLDSALFMCDKYSSLNSNSKEQNALIEGIRGIALYNKGLVGQAVNKLEQSIKMGVSDAGVYRHLANIYYQQEDYQSAIKYYLTAVNLAPDSFESHFKLGCSYIKQLNYDDALIEFKIATLLDKNNTDAQNKLNETYASIRI
jgi:tetratricopeptide (TPR) repeat protein